MRKLQRIRAPIADIAKPTRIQVKHFQSQLRGLRDHAPRESFIHCHAAAPAVVDQQGVGRVAQRARIIEHASHPTAHDVAGAIRAAVECTDEYCRRLKAGAGRQSRLEGSRAGIKACLSAQGCAATLKGDPSTPAELDPDIPTAPGVCGLVDQQIWNHLSRRVRDGPRISTSEAPLPSIAVAQCIEMGPLRGGDIRALFHPKAFQRSARIDLPIETQAGQWRQPDGLAAQVLDQYAVLERAPCRTRAPPPHQPKARRIREVHRFNFLRSEAAGRAIQVPHQRCHSAVNLDAIGQGSRRSDLSRPCCRAV